MSKNEIATTNHRPSALITMAGKYNVEPAALLSTLKDTAFKGATDSQMMALCVVANEYGLNPFTKEIYAFPDSKGGGIVPIIGVDGWYRIVNDNPNFDGCEFEESRDQKGGIESITCRIHRKDRSHPVVVTEWLAECKRNTPPWNGQPVRMLRHRAFIQCARVAFGLSAMDPEDAARITVDTGRRELDTKGANPFDKPLPATAPAPTEEVEDIAWEVDGKEGEA